jgi:hypothetical protein
MQQGRGLSEGKEPKLLLKERRTSFFANDVLFLPIPYYYSLGYRERSNMHGKISGN